ncbi:hypothetical protein [Mucilaginibacter sp.]|uniref:baeRF3 domain-containing protein n=1 Tax=Mucilaginibacter sp. TaxID=1882438 RepID=UPI0028512089|nr:hypothetical protein [Mucilaginibacter sp.]MDR3694927.1 hypothetical protein [Mucilaginibacter sp.]
MNQFITPEIKDVLKAVHYRPAVSIIMPFKTKINLHTELRHSLKIAADKVERELIFNYPAEICKLLMQKLLEVIENIDFNTGKKGIVIYVSLVFEKVLYLDIPVEEKVIVDDSFEIRDLVYNTKQLHKYLLLVLSGKETKIYLGNAELLRVELNMPESVYAYVNDAPERVANFSDMSDRKETIMDKFLLNIDNGLNKILNTYKLPLVVLGTERIAGHFKKLTRHAAAVIEYIHGNYEEATLPDLRETASRYIAGWEKLEEKKLLDKLEEAAGANKLAVGIKDVWHEAVGQNGRLLVVEKNFRYAAQHGATQAIIDELVEPFDKFPYIRDAVDDIIEKVLQNGGDIEFVDQDILKDYDHIALVQYY